jgi:hypothetical protein
VSTNVEHLRQVAGQYFAGNIQSLVTLGSISFSPKLFDKAMLKLTDADAFRQACFNATRDVEDARWDDAAYGWVIDDPAIARAFVNAEYARLNPADQMALLNWLADGAGRDRAFDFARDFWFSAAIWAQRAGEFPERAEALLQAMTPEQLGFAQEFCAKLRAALDDPAYHEAAAGLCKMPPDDTDLFQMTKFHIVFPDDDTDEDAYDEYAPDPFMALGLVRNGNILRAQLAPIVAKGNPFEIDALDKMVQVFVAQDQGLQQYSPDFARQTEAYLLRNLYDWSRHA